MTILFLIIKSYLALFVGISCGSLLMLMAGLYWIFRKPTPKTKDSSDFTAIAGDDIFATQLDLARAFMETDKLLSAKTILKQVAKQGSDAQQIEARKLLSLI